MTNSIFITGTGTGVGKTLVTGLLGRLLTEKGKKVITQKWVQTGCAGVSEDIAAHMRVIGCGDKYFGSYRSDMAPYVLKFPSSPHLAASIEKERIDPGRIERSFRRLARDFDVVIVEGTGGLMVPIDEGTVIADIAEKLCLNTLIVAENRLGVINQTLLTVESLRKRKLRIVGIIFNRLSESGDDLILKDNMRIVGKLTGEEILGELEYNRDTDALYGKFRPAGERIFERLTPSTPGVATPGVATPGVATPGVATSGVEEGSLIQRDMKYIWHPYTQMKDCESLPPVPVARAEGVKLYDYDGNFYYDTISSWWCNVHGHNHPVIKSAIKRQLDTVQHILFAGFTHRPAVELAERLVGITPRNLTKVFYSDNGSTAVEVALKMSFQYWQNTGKEGKTRFLSLDMAYHGDTVGAMSVSGVDLFNRRFKPLFFKAFKVPTPYCYRCPFGKKRGECALECLRQAEEILRHNADRISAIVIEPVLMGAAGMIVYPLEYLKGIWDLSRKYNVHLIADEIATGFGRTGKMFACEHAEIEPDFMCLSKGITSGYLPMGATLTTEEVYKAFYDDYGKLKTFFHGHTFTGNPVSCAAAVASIDLFGTEGTLEKVPEINSRLGSFLREMSALSIVGDTRGIGAVGAMELVKDKRTREPFGPDERIGMEVYEMGLKKKLLFRPLGNVIYFFLPLCVGRDEMDDIFQKAADVIHSASQNRGFPVK